MDGTVNQLNFELKKNIQLKGKTWTLLNLNNKVKSKLSQTKFFVFEQISAYVCLKFWQFSSLPTRLPCRNWLRDTNCRLCIFPLQKDLDAAFLLVLLLRSSQMLQHRQHSPWSSHHVAQEMAALCSLAFMRKAAILEDLRSGSMLRSYVLIPGDPPNRLPMWGCPMWPPGLGTPRKSETPLAEWGWGVMQGVIVSQGTTQPGTGDAALLPLSQDGFWI